MNPASSREPVLRIEQLEVGYAGQPVLRGVDLEVRTGEIWFLLGPNGSGKTTLLHAILGMLPARAGRVWRHPEHAARERLGYVPQRCELDPTLPTTVREFVSLGFVGARVPRAERPAHLARALAQVGLGERAGASYWALSGGQRQRALAARALVRRPSLMLLDEPTEGLDVSAGEAFLHALLEQNARDGLTLLFVTHELDLAARHATHVALFSEGRVRAGLREEVLAPEEVRRVFGVSLDLASREACAPPAAARGAGA